MRRLTLLLLVTGLLIGVSGCKNCGRWRLFDRSDRTRLDAPAPMGTTDPLLIPPPSGGLPTPSSDALPPARSTPDLPSPVMPETRSEKLPETKNGKELILPDPLPGGTSKGGYLESPAELNKTDSTSQSPAKEAPAQSSTGLTGFALVRDSLATGRKPSLEGFDSLKDSGYKTVILLHPAASDPAAARTIAEKRGLKFLAIPVDADAIKPAFQRFVEAVGDSSIRPAYVCDETGARTGVLWYTYFRAVENLGDDAAQVKAAGLGLRDGGAEKDKLLAAAQSYLATR